MITILIILAFIAVALIYLLQFQIVRDYQPIKLYLLKDTAFTDYKTAWFMSDQPAYRDYPMIPILSCNLKRYSIFKWRV